MKSVQHVFDLGAYDCVSGKKLPNVRIGYETYGTLNPDGSNAILVCHYFSGNARAAGPADDALLPGQAVGKVPESPAEAARAGRGSPDPAAPESRERVRPRASCPPGAGPAVRPRECGRPGAAGGFRRAFS